jgi:SAM-dependent methyltransferase
VSYRARLSHLVFERRSGIATEGDVDWDELGYEDTRRFRYEPSGWLSLPLALPRREVTADDVFADLGCGKGRIVVQAALRYPMKRVIGVELAPQLHDIARRNVDRIRTRARAADIQVVNGDVLEWALPPDLSIVYLYNPLLGELFSALAERLVAHAREQGKPLRVIYLNPEEHERLVAAGPIREIPTPNRALRRIAGIPDDEIRRYVIDT